MSDGVVIAPAFTSNNGYLLEYKHCANFNYLPSYSKGRPLDVVLEFTLSDSGLDYTDLTSNTNFKNTRVLEHSEADWLVKDKVVIENKNWNSHYTITKDMAYNKIITKFHNYLQYPLKVLVISNPRWGAGVKQFIMAHGIKIIELGYQVTFNPYLLERAYLTVKAKLFRLLGLASSIIIAISSILVDIKCVINRVFTGIKDLASKIAAGIECFKDKIRGNLTRNAGLVHGSMDRRLVKQWSMKLKDWCSSLLNSGYLQAFRRLGEYNERE